MVNFFYIEMLEISTAKVCELIRVAVNRKLGSPTRQIQHSRKMLRAQSRAVAVVIREEGRRKRAI